MMNQNHIKPVKAKPSPEVSGQAIYRQAKRPPRFPVHRLPSFTMLELITVLTLSSIIIGIAYTAYEVIYSDFLDYKNTNEEALQTMDFVTVLERDIARCDSAIIQDCGIQFFQKQHIIQYEFNETNTVRYLVENTVIIDTFSLEIRTFEAESKTLFLEYIPTYLECSELEKLYSLSFEINSISEE
jgi:hypothetical protein